MALGQYIAIQFGTWWYCVSIGHLCLFIILGQSRQGLAGGIVGPGYSSSGSILGCLPFFRHNSKTKSQKIDPKVPNEPSLRGLQTGLWQNLGSYGKKRIFRPRTEKKHLFLNSNHVLATTGKSCAEKVPLSQIDISLFANFGCFFGDKKNGFLAKMLYAQT